MSKTIRIRNVPADVYETLKLRAAGAGLSLSEYLRRELERMADRPSIAEVLARAGGRSGGVTRQDIVDAVRSGRD
ncbi:MAG: FitA-like ribbon-helix-helix domain-containing protein [Actinomycetota bacterium]